MAWFKCVGPIEGGGGISLPTNFWKGNQTDYDNLSSYDDSTLYEVIQTVNTRSTMSYTYDCINKIYIGSTQVFPVQKDGYDFVIEDITFPSSGDNDYQIKTGIDLIGHSSGNYNRNWQLEFKVELDSNPQISGDYVILGGQRSTSGLWEIYLNSSGDLYLFGHGVSDANYCSGANNHDIKIVRDGETLYVYKDNVLEYTKTGYLQNDYGEGSSTDYGLQINRYSGNSNYRFPGTIHYLKFKWLPTT